MPTILVPALGRDVVWIISMRACTGACTFVRSPVETRHEAGRWFSSDRRPAGHLVLTLAWHLAARILVQDQLIVPHAAGCQFGI
jgi:hypothetical protein